MQFSIRTLLYLTLYCGVLFAWLKFCYSAFPVGFWILFPHDILPLASFAFAFYYSRTKRWPNVRAWIVMASLLILLNTACDFLFVPLSLSLYFSHILSALQALYCRGWTLALIALPIIGCSIRRENLREVFLNGKWEWASVVVGIADVSLLLCYGIWLLTF